MHFHVFLAHLIPSPSDIDRGFSRVHQMTATAATYDMQHAMICAILSFIYVRIRRSRAYLVDLLWDLDGEPFLMHFEAVQADKFC